MTSHALFTMPIRIYYEDTDAGGVVYHANYLRYAERARTEWLREAAGLDQREIWQHHGVGFVVRKAEIDYRKPALLDDALTADVRLVSIGRSSMVLEQHIKREEDTLAVMHITLVCVTKDIRPARIPEHISGLLK